MNPPELTLARAPYHDPEVRLDRLYRPFVRRWRFVGACVVAAWAAALALVLVPEREYRAQTVLAAIPSARGASLAGGLSAFLGNAQLGGVQSTPYFITRLLMLRGVLGTVADSPVSDTDRRRIIERVLDRPAAEISKAEIEPAMRDLLAAEVDKQTGLVTFSVTHPDSALARTIAVRLVGVARAAYVKVVRSQATDQRLAGEAVVDSVRRQLRRAEQAFQDFQTSHRVYASYSDAAVTRQRLERDLTSAQAAYTQAMADRTAAIARELEATPSVVVVDEIPADLTPVPRQAVLKLLLATMLGLAAAAVVMAMRGEFTPAELRVREEVRSAA
jgi:uncharacterized protein involved in exopolysaccharide biosynthesis